MLWLLGVILLPQLIFSEANLGGRWGVVCVSVASRQEYWNWLPFSSPGDLPDTGIEPRSPALQADSLPSELPGKPGVLFI